MLNWEESLKQMEAAIAEINKQTDRLHEQNQRDRAYLEEISQNNCSHK